MIVLVVFAHLSFSGLTEYENVMVDDRAYSPYIEGYSGEPSSLGIRWMAVGRQWCIPLLFWVSGASAALAFKKKRCHGLGRIFLLTVVGIASNGSVWMLGPHNPDCWPLDHDKPQCEDGKLFKFSVCAGDGEIFPWVFQMWYTAALVLITLLNTPLMNVVDGRRGLCSLLCQWIVSMLAAGSLLQIASAGALLSSDVLPEKYQWLASVGQDYFESPPEVPDVRLAFNFLAISEALFLVTGYLASRRKPDSCIPLRVFHYTAGAMMVLTLATPFANVIGHITPCFVLWCFTVMNRSFQMGFIMTRPLAKGGNDDLDGPVKPLFSKCWPGAIVLVTLFAPSTNFYLAGNLTYPYLPGVVDRCMYAAGAIVLFFLVDRAGQTFESVPVPKGVSWAALLIYLFHPWVMTLIIDAGLRAPEDTVRRDLLTNVGFVWPATIFAVYIPVAGLVACCRCCCRRPVSAREGRMPANTSWQPCEDVPEVYMRLASPSDDDE